MPADRRSSYLASFGVPAIFVAALVLACSSGGDGTPTREYAQADVAGTWDSVTFQVGAQTRWARRYSTTIDEAGAVTGSEFLDDLGNKAELSPAVWIQVGGAGDLTRIWSGFGADTFRGFLGRNRNLIAGVSTPEAGSYDLTIARKRDVVTIFDAADIGSRAVSIHTLRSGSEGWRYASGTIDPSGVVSVDATMGPAFATTIVYAPPPPHGATLSVDADGFVTDGADFQGFLTADKTTIVAVHNDGATRALTLIQLKGGTFTQADLAGTWGFSTLVGGMTAPGWVSGKLTTEANGLVTYVSQLDHLGSTALSSATTFHLDSDGRMTNATNPSYRGTLALDGQTYVRTQTNGGTTPGRYGISLVVRR
jgi:hypothetical protein